jgi:pre-rRNA-processing protein TSR2
MEDEFEVVIEEGDPSLWKVAEQIVRIRRDCAEGRFENVDVLRVRWQEGKGKKIEGLYKKGEDPDQDTDWDEDDEEEDDEDGDEDMGDAPPLVQTRREKPEPEVDEDGFTKVTRKKR